MADGLPQIVPYLVEVAVPVPLSAVEEALTAGRDAIDAFLLGQTLTGFTVATADPGDDSGTVASTEYVQREFRDVDARAEGAATRAAVSAQQAADLVAQLRAGVAAEVQAQLARLGSTLPRSQPDGDNAVWISNGSMVVTPPASTT